MCLSFFKNVFFITGAYAAGEGNILDEEGCVKGHRFLIWKQVGTGRRTATWHRWQKHRDFVTRLITCAILAALWVAARIIFWKPPIHPWVHLNVNVLSSFYCKDMHGHFCLRGNAGKRSMFRHPGTNGWNGGNENIGINMHQRVDWRLKKRIGIKMHQQMVFSKNC